MTESTENVPSTPDATGASPSTEAGSPATSETPTDGPNSTSGTKTGEPTPEQQLSQLKDLLLRRAAEFENYKRRVEQELSTTIRMANEGLILAIIPIMDDLERSLKAGKDAQDPASFYRGVELIAQKLSKVFESQGVRSFESAGQPFDVHRHDALLQVPNASVPPSTVLEEVDRGYTMHDKVIRHAKVVVSTAPPETPAEEA